MKERKAYWIGGTVTALVGVALVRLVAPELAGVPGIVTLATGYLMVTAGITAIACATRRKSSEAFVTVASDGRPLDPDQARRDADQHRRRPSTA